MPSHKEEEPVEFKVVDRRKFTSDGAPRPDAPAEEEPEPAKSAPVPASATSAQPAPASAPDAPQAAAPHPAQPTPPAAPQTAPPQAAEQAPPQLDESLPPTGNLAGGVQFEHLIMSLVTQAMLQLGLATRPGELAPHPDFPAAHETIDILGILQLKTKGNLTMQEEQLLTGSLSELRMAYLELNRRAAGRIN